MKVNLILFICLFVFTSAVACVDSKYNECNQVIEITLNMANQTKNFYAQDDNKTPQQTLHLADSFDEAVAQLDLLKLQDKNIIKYKNGLGLMYSTLSKATRNFVDALSKKNLAQAQSAKQKLQEQSITEQELLKSLRYYCQGNKL